jgi:hypothetical protein
MGEYTTELAPIPASTIMERPVRRPRIRGGLTLPALAFAAAASIVMVAGVDPTSGAVASGTFQASVAELSARNAQTVTLDATTATAAVALAPRENFSVVAPPPPPPPPAPVQVAAPKAAAAKSASASKSTSSGGAVAPSAGVPSAGSAQAVAHEMVLARGWGEEQYSCLVSLWKKESGWRVNAQNGSSGAYGIPQALPGSKMASAGSDWATNPATQIAWGLGYITSRYSTPCGAWATSQARGWY